MEITIIMSNPEFIISSVVGALVMPSYFLLKFYLGHKSWKK
jgi:hypothetical protein